jgi:hypothetical protein
MPDARKPVPAPDVSNQWWTPAHTEGLRGLGRGLMQDYQSGMGRLGELSEHPLIQTLGAFLPLLGGVVTKFPQTDALRRKFMLDRADHLERKLWKISNSVEDPASFGLMPGIKQLQGRTEKVLETAKRMKPGSMENRTSGSYYLIDPLTGDELGSYRTPEDAKMVQSWWSEYLGRPEAHQYQIQQRKAPVVKFPTKPEE